MAERGTGFPRLSLMSAVQIIDIASKYGKSWPRAQFAGFGVKSGSASTRSGAFAARVSSLRDYGMIVADKNNISITDLGQKISKPVTVKEREDAITQAFLSVSTFNDLVKSFESRTPLKLDQVALHAVHRLGISRESKDKFINSFIDSGSYAKLVSFNKEDNTLTLNALAEEGGELKVATYVNEPQIDASDVAQQGEYSGTPNNPTTLKYSTTRLSGNILVCFPEDLSFEVTTGYFAEPIMKLDELAKKLDKSEQ